MRIVRRQAIKPYGDMEWRAKLRLCRERARLSQKELASMVGVAQTRVTEWETGKGIPTMDKALRVARALGVSLDYLADDALDEPPPATEERSEADAMILALARRWGYERAVLQLADYPVIRVAQPPPGKPPGESSGNPAPG
jgi:transcriptional regulator with XRE-family HTH domain